jgi:hypothetical protein
MYASLVDSDLYFLTRLHSDGWDETSLSDRTAALTTATLLIDRLNFRGDKAVSTQANEFPRGDDTVVPEDIKIACMEIAYSMLVDGRDPDIELENLAIVSEGFANIRDTRNDQFVHEHINAGIVSARAWKFIRPYLRNDKSFKITRTS